MHIAVACVGDGGLCAFYGIIAYHVLCVAARGVDFSSGRSALHGQTGDCAHLANTGEHFYYRNHVVYFVVACYFDLLHVFLVVGAARYCLQLSAARQS